MDHALQTKQGQLRDYLESLGSVAVAFSGGADSSLLLCEAVSVLGDAAIAITARSRAYPRSETEQAIAFCGERDITHLVFDYDELAVDGFRENSPDRCYYCKHELFQTVLDLAHEQGVLFVVEGSNADDVGDYRPGLRAIRELGIKSPLLEAGITKAEVRALSRELGLPSWNKPSAACLASRIAYGDEITAENLTQVERAEDFLHDEGFSQVRVRIHGPLARIEVLPEDIERLATAPLRARLAAALHDLGLHYVTLDLEGFRSGSMNSVLEND